MVTCLLSFKGAAVSEDDKDSFIDDASSLVQTFRRNGQIVSANDIYLFQQDAVVSYVHAFSADSLLPQYNNKYVNDRLIRIKENYGLMFSFEVLTNDEEPAYGFAASSAFILQWGGASPLRSFDSFEQIPLYMFPYTYHDGYCHNDINFWEGNYDSIYDIWRRSEIEEERFSDYLALIDSPLSVQGSNVCRRIEALTGKKCYYHLFSYDNTRYDEKCPSCHSDWVLSEKMFDKFDLRCDKCNIISQKALYDDASDE
ncbi:Predicted nucleic acid-binding protein, contains Zn-ribbon domain [Chitinophaga sp. YR627]|uniref:DUF2310 family Zn-ribbon-containing protein n=1 Tax=Chitinophaga sp. YR627 TaxID=1881041 RepID=UPI0008E9AFBE|nr:DUF2310 family Zn-ribbon-containing protein [Chitinophaga sp. YR627]SFM74289.1 Predicted nucleic acid-binding protein, contains Zn-ribbon domain [Chitinophaga sp. YR627]